MLKRLSKPHRWTDLGELFPKHTPQLSEVFWEMCYEFLELREDPFTGPMTVAYLSARVEKMEERVYMKIGALFNFVGFINGVVIEIARRDDAGLENIVQKGHKRKFTLK